MEMLQKTALGITIVGAINWGLIGLLDFNLVSYIFGDTLISKIIYILVGISGIINIGIYMAHLDFKRD